MVVEAASRQDQGLLFHTPGESDELRASIPYPQRFRNAFAAGAMVLEGAELRSQSIASLCDELTLAHEAVVATAIVGRGDVAPGTPLTETTDRLVVVALGGPLDIAAGDLHQVGISRTLTLAADHAVLVNSVHSIAVPDRSRFLALPVGVCDQRAFWLFASQKAGFWPRLRCNFPYDYRSQLIRYGETAPVRPMDSVLNDLASLLGSELVEEVKCRWGVMLESRKRPELSDLLSVISEPQRTAGLMIRGNLVGSVAQPIDQPADSDFFALAVAGRILILHRHLLDLIGVISYGSSKRLDDLHVECPTGDPLCTVRFIESLSSLNLVRLSQVRQ